MTSTVPFPGSPRSSTRTSNTHRQSQPNDGRQNAFDKEVDEAAIETVIEIRTIGIGQTPSPGNERLFTDYGRFRGWMYAFVANISCPTELDHEGTDFDHFDPFSVHLAAVERLAKADAGDDEERIVGVSRLIVDLDDRSHPYVTAGLRTGLGPLPIERHFPELRPAVVDLRTDRIRCEVSRYAAHHQTPGQQQRITSALRRAVVKHYVNLGGTDAFAVVERPLAAQLRLNGVSLQRITAPRLLPQYGSVNFGIRLDLDRLARDLGVAETSCEPYAISEDVLDAINR